MFYEFEGICNTNEHRVYGKVDQLNGWVSEIYEGARGFKCDQKVEDLSTNWWHFSGKEI